MTKKKESEKLNPPPLLESGEAYALNKETRKRANFLEGASDGVPKSREEDEIDLEEPDTVLNRIPESPPKMSTGSFDLADVFSEDEDTIEQPPTEEVSHHLLAETLSDYQAPVNVPSPPPIPDLFTLDDGTPEPLPAPSSPSRQMKGSLLNFGHEFLRRARYVFRRAVVPSLVILAGLLTTYVLTTMDGGTAFSMDSLKRQLSKVSGTASYYVDEVRGEVWNLEGGAKGPDSLRQEKVPSIVEELPLKELPSSVPTRQSLRRTALSPKKPENTVRTVSHSTNVKALSSASKGNLGVIRVDGNRRALIYVGDEPVGYSPVNVSAPVGRYEVTATLPSRPGVTEKKSATLSSRGEVVELYFSFSDQK
jgi:hypothetical protein